MTAVAEAAPRALARMRERVADPLLDRLGSAVGGPARRRVVLLFAGVLALNSADQATTGAVATQLRHSLHVSNTDIGVIVTVSSVTSALATLPIGLLADRVNRVRVLSLSMGAWALAMIVSGFAQSFGMLVLTRLALGAALATAYPLIASLAGDLFPPGERARIYGYILSGELIGTAFGFLVSGDVAAAVGWRGAYWVLAVPSALLGWLLWRLLPEPARGGASRIPAGAGRIRGREEVRDRPPPAGAQSEADREDDLALEAVAAQRVEPDRRLVLDLDPARMSLRQSVRYILSIRTNVVLIVVSSLGYFFFAGINTFAVEFMRHQYRLGQAAASTLLVLVGLGALAGVQAGGRVADRRLARGDLTARVVVPVGGVLVAVVAFGVGIPSGTLAIALPLFALAAAGLAVPNPPLDAARLDIMHFRLWGRAESVRTVIRGIATGAAP